MANYSVLLVAALIVISLPVLTLFILAPLVRRITPGIPVRFDFGVRLPEGSDASDTATP